MTSITIVNGNPIVARSKDLITPLTVFLFIISENCNFDKWY